MQQVESRETSNRKYFSKTILACRERQAKNASDAPNINVSTERLNRSHILQQMLKSSLHQRLQMRQASDTHL